MSKETVQVPLTRVRDANGQPSCACSFETGEICDFYRTQRFGFNETCLFAPDTLNGIGSILQRRKNGEGTLIPGNWCPLWSINERV